MPSDYGFTISVIIRAEGENEALAAANRLVSDIKAQNPESGVHIVDAGIEEGPDDMIGDEG